VISGQCQVPGALFSSYLTDVRQVVSGPSQKILRLATSSDHVATTVAGKMSAPLWASIGFGSSGLSDFGTTYMTVLPLVTGIGEVVDIQFVFFVMNFVCLKCQFMCIKRLLFGVKSQLNRSYNGLYN
jgi:hypothetical protein